MAFTPVDLPIQEMLQTDFIVDLSQIHNSNVLLLKDKVEDIINNFEIDVNSISIGTDNAINSIKTQDAVIQDGGIIFQTGIPNQIIARLSKNGNNESVFNVDHLTVDLDIVANSLDINDVTINTSAVFDGEVTFNESISYKSAIVESKENVEVLLEFDTVNKAIGTITLTNTSKRNIYVTLAAEANLGFTQVWNGAIINALIADFILNVDFDVNNPPAENTTFTIHIVNVIENSGQSSIISSVTSSSIPVSIQAGTNNSTATQILLHYDLATSGDKLAISPADLQEYGSNATFNYIKDQNTNDRLIITSMVAFNII